MSPTKVLRKRKADVVAEPVVVPVEVAKRPRRSDAAKGIATPDTAEDEIEAPSQVLDKDSDFGTSTAVKVFYEGKALRHGGVNWVEKPPKQLNVQVVKANNRFAITIFKVKDYTQPTIGGITPLKIQTVELQSAPLVAALKDIVKDEGMHLETTETARFSEPFKPLFFCRDKILGLQSRKHDGKFTDEHVALLAGVMDELFGGFAAHLANLRASGLITYKLAWTYFAKGSMLYCGTSDSERVCRVTSTAYVTHPCPLMVVNCEEVAFDGEAYAWVPLAFEIPAFAGNLPVTDLPCYPLSFHGDPEGMKGRLVTRAKKTLAYQELTYCEYTGMAVRPGKCGMLKYNVEGRILVDYFGYGKHHEGLTRTDAKSKRRPGASDADTEGQKSYVTSLPKEKQEENIKEMLGPRAKDLVFMSPLLKGFALKNKKWLQFYVDDITPVIWNDEAYGHLVYPEEQKDLVLTFVDNHRRMKTGVDDVIQGKGQGLILLLSGPPGTGKTLTAEAVADKSRRPLYYLQAEDLGIKASELGPKIKNVFEMATEWDAVILLDEADVFMAERDPGDISRNELVSIFLRELEYFRGIIFLTTNLYSTIDAAFRSRVNIHLLFKSLPFSSRLLLWQKFLSRLPNDEEGGRMVGKLAESDMRELAKWDLNGREIKNAIKTVRTWCLCKDFEMNLLRLESGIVVTAPQARKVEEIETEE